MLLYDRPFSRRLPHTSDTNALYAAAYLKQQDVDFIDLTQTNPTHCGFVAPCLTSTFDSIYQSDPQGSHAARQAIANYITQQQYPCDPAQLILTNSTSEAYSWLFKLLANPGETILAPTPSYPLIEHLAQLEGLSVRYYHLDEAHSWQPDVDAIAALLDSSVKAIVLVCPHNPTGATLLPHTLHALQALSHKHALAWIVDEVFAPYGHALHTLPDVPLCFRLNGLSKIAALPQLKLAWINISGCAPYVHAACQHLLWIADMYLPVSSAVQHMLPNILACAPGIQADINQRMHANHTVLSHILANIPAVTLQPYIGGWSTILKIPQEPAEEAISVALLDKSNCLVHPGYFYDMQRSGYLVGSLLVPQADFLRGWQRVVSFLEKNFY